MLNTVTIPHISETFAPFGARIEGIDFRNAPSDEIVAALKRALAQHHVLVSRGHPTPGDEDIEQFFSAFGDLSSNTPEVKEHFRRLAKLVPEYIEEGAEEVGSRFNLSNVEEDGKKMGGLGNRELEWHNDQADLHRLKTISCLEALEVDPEAGRTYFCDMYAVLETLPQTLRSRLENAFAIHDSSKYRSDDGSSNTLAPSASHPILLAHPETGRKCLYVNPNFTSRVIGLPETDSQSLLDILFSHSYHDEYVYEHHWRTGDIVFWDNVGLQHMRKPLDSTKRRTLRVFQGVSEAWTLPDDFRKGR
ncbi:MAG: TauD/TfdA family dioxygenase [Rhodospirillaceae bacterium]